MTARLLAVVLLLFPLGLHAQTPSEAPRPELLGEPFAKAFPALYPRNIWTMRLYQGRLYLGGGNSSNQPPAPNAGPVPLVAYDIKGKSFTTEAVLREEQIDRITPVGGRLCIIGHDPTQNWEFGNLHCRGADGEWIKHRTLPGVLHGYDLAEYGGALVAAVSNREGAALAVSRDQGQSWEIQALGPGRTYALLKVAGRLYAAKTFPKEKRLARDPTNRYPVAEMGPDFMAVPRYDLYAPQLFPQTDLSEDASRKIIRSLEAGDAAFYIGALIHNDHQARPIGLYRAASLRQGDIRVARIALPQGAAPWDIVMYRGTLYILTNTPLGDGYEVAVHAMPPGAEQPPRRLAAFRSATFARSFEVDADALYFGLGCETDRFTEDAPLPPQCGQLLRLAHDVAAPR